MPSLHLPPLCHLNDTYMYHLDATNAFEVVVLETDGTERTSVRRLPSGGSPEPLSADEHIVLIDRIECADAQ